VAGADGKETEAPAPFVEFSLQTAAAGTAGGGTTAAPSMSLAAGGPP